MKRENLFNAIGLVSDEKIAEAESYVGRPKQKRMGFNPAYTSLAAMCAVVLVVAGVFVHLYNSQPDDVIDEPFEKVFVEDEALRAEIERYVEILSAPNVGGPFNNSFDMEIFGSQISFTPNAFNHPSELPAGFFIYRYMCDVIYGMTHQLDGGSHTINIDDLIAHTRGYYWADFSEEMLDFTVPSDWTQEWNEEARTFTLRGGTRGADIAFYMSGGVFYIIEIYELGGLYYALTSYGITPFGEIVYQFADIMHVFEKNASGNLNLVSKLPYDGELPSWLVAVQAYIFELAGQPDERESPFYIEPLGFSIHFNFSIYTYHGALYHELFDLFREFYGKSTPTMKINDIIEFGGYDWRVLDVGLDLALIITEDVIDNRPYHSSGGSVTWENSEIRAYLNGEFYENTFTDAEKMLIYETMNINKDNQRFGTNGGNNTADRVFLLSLEEVVRYFGDSGQLENGNTFDDTWIVDEYDESRIAHFINGGGAWWWLRSPGESGGYAAGVSDRGSISVYGSDIDRGDDIAGVRPAMWIDKYFLLSQTEDNHEQERLFFADFAHNFNPNDLQGRTAIRIDNVGDERMEEIIILSDATLRDLRFHAFGGWYSKNDELVAFRGRHLFDLETLEPNSYLEFKPPIPPNLDFLIVTFTDSNNIIHSYILGTSGKDGSFGYGSGIRVVESVGNTPANIQNGGRIVYHNGWVYYASPFGGIRKMREDGTETTIINERNLDTWLYLNVINNSLFYTDFNSDNLINTLYKSSLDGTNETVVQSFTERGFSNITVVDEWIYYKSGDFIYRMRLDGTEQTQLSHVRSLDMMIDDGWIYFSGYIDWVDSVYFGINYIYKMRLDGSELTRFNDAYDDIEISSINADSAEMAFLHYNRISSFVVDSGFIYYVTEDYRTIYRMRTDFTEKTVVIPEPEDEYMLLQTVHATSGWLYYYEFVPVAFTGELKRINSDGEIQSILIDVGNICIAGDWIYYYVNNEFEFSLYRIRLDGTVQERIE